MNEDVKQITITIEEVSQKGNRIAIKGGGKSYSFFTTKKSDGEETKAYSQWKNMAQGGDITINYSEKQGEYQDKKTGETKQATYRNVLWFEDGPVSAPATQQVGDVTNTQILDAVRKVYQYLQLIEKAKNEDVAKKDDIPVIEPEIDTSDIPF